MQRIEAYGSETNAIVDCLAEGSNGYLILDHKTGAVDETGERFATYLPQLDAYAKLVREVLPAKPVPGLAVNWVDTGIVSVLADSVPVASAGSPLDA